MRHFLTEQSKLAFVPLSFWCRGRVWLDASGRRALGDEAFGMVVAMLWVLPGADLDMKISLCSFMGYWGLT